MWKTFLRPTSLKEALDLVGGYGTEARPVAGSNHE
jgi:CO/xanthine dehydrogenase FAD-binding subunit